MRALIATTLFLTGLVLTGAAQEPEKQPDKKPDEKKLEDKKPDEKKPDEKKPDDMKPDEKKKLADPTEPPILDVRGVPAVVEGGYTVAYGERDGKQIPPEQLKDAIVRFTGGRVVGTDKDRTEILVATYVLDTTKTPWAIEMKLYEPRGAVVPGLVKKDGHVLTIVFADPGGETPKEFKTKEKQRMFVLRGFVLDPLPPPNKFGSTP